MEESELLSSKPLIHLESIEDYIGKCNPQNIKSCDYGYYVVSFPILLRIQQNFVFFCTASNNGWSMTTI